MNPQDIAMTKVGLSTSLAQMLFGQPDAHAVLSAPSGKRGFLGVDASALHGPQDHHNVAAAFFPDASLPRRKGVPAAFNDEKEPKHEEKAKETDK
mmetsp:Transcript_127800/g.255240  ORF Transcript_127800/g.255240 Transcript_127800/m.255240 type:complete len:95 (-) Transcript_127800:37-321(-)